MIELLKRLRQRKIVQWAIAYVAFAFAVIQVVDVVADRFAWSATVVRFLILAFAIGFFVVLVLAWYHGERGVQRIGAAEMFIITLLLVIGGIVVDSYGRGVIAPHDAVTTQTTPAVASSATMRALAASRLSPLKAAPAAPSAPIPAKSIAVLPFVNESGDAKRQYFSDGLSEDLITALSQFAGLKVISRDSAFQFRNSKDSSAAIGKALGVAHLLEGTVRRAGNEVRITATLVNAANGSTLWSEHYDRPYKDLFALQDAITKAVANALQAKLLTTPGAVVQSDRPPSGNLAAYAAYLQGQADVALFTPQGTRGAIEHFRTATHLDAKYALAYAALARAWVWTFRAGHTATDGSVDIAHARSAIKTALTLDPNLAAAHATHAYLLFSMDFDWYGAQAEYRRALQLAPNDATAKAGLGAVLGALGHHHAAIALGREALAANPRSAVLWLGLGSGLISVDQLDAAEQAVRKGIKLNPDSIYAYVRLAMIAILRGDAHEAMALAQEERGAAWRQIGVALAAQVGPDRKVAHAALQKLIAQYAGAGAFQIAEVYALRKDPDDMFKWLDRAWLQRDSGIALLLSDPFILRYKHDPRFAVFCKKVGLPTTTDAVAMK